MKKELIILFLILLHLSTWAQEIPQHEYSSVPPKEFYDEMTYVNNPILLDVREFFEYRRSRIPQSINIPSSGDISRAADTLNKGGHIFLYCTTGYRSRRVAEELASRGFIHLYSLDGGIKAWRKEGFRVERKKIPR